MAVEYIHEFSTGITLERQNGQLVSKGFTVGEYMNRTMEKIPQCVERAIANKLFEVSKNSQSPEPTIVGRVVLGDKTQGELDWSVVAIVTTGKDNYQRQTDLYRYFLCEGAKSLWKIVDWIEDYRHKYNRWPSYNPADTKTIGQPTRHDCGRQKEPLQSSWHDFLNTKPTPIIFQSEPSYDLKNLNAMAEYKAETESQLISWVWNVEAIENLSNFLVIQAASYDAYILLEKMRQFQASQPRPALGSGVDMAGIESSIKGLIGGGNIKPEWIQTIVQAKQQNQLTEEQWEKIFNDLGANSRSFSANIVRLLTLRAIILPKTLPHYLQYLDIQKPDQNPNQQQQISLEFQSQIRSYRNLLDSFLSEGAISVADLIGHYRRMEYVPAVAWLFDGGQPGLWLKYKAIFVLKVQEYFKRFSSPRKEYAPLEKLFKEWGYQLYTYSYVSRSSGGTRSTGSILSQEPENISVRERLQSNIFEVIVQGLVLVIFLILAGKFPTNNAVGYVLIYAIASGLIRVFLNKKQIDNTLKVVGVLFTILITIMALMALMVNNYVTESTKLTREAITKIVNDLSQERPKSEGGSNNYTQATNDEEARKKIVIEALLETLNSHLDDNNSSKLQYKQYKAVIEGEVGDDKTKEEDPDKWIKAIKSYQTKNNMEQKDGYITEESPTDTELRKDIQKNQLFTFDKRTRVALNKIVSELKNPDGGSPTEKDIINKIKAALNNNNGITQLDYEKAMQGDPVEIKKLVEAIKEYQQSKQLSKADGIIDQGGDTYNKLKEDLAKN
ncbi:hypothetical protein [Planktothricoides raciborskii]|uniref:Uncharacterized protein n=1 Tax=Planktothricoides raciborskii FACHB-1370 TaxID=2949576 RepID=A0ABR8EDD9_9CYAN|nr:hypothetical protein [Planktothricoides raciborskii]MBD2544520.1 hypothetical protein [Planktothricoides raciborskii FACHB-1370]MBD2585225.1 hypothetical protein [Planktothricoides raciborskii FACHB-1261]